MLNIIALFKLSDIQVTLLLTEKMFQINIEINYYRPLL